MQTPTPCTAACTPQAEPARPGRARPALARLLSRIRDVLLGPNKVRRLPIGHPEAFVDRPGERRIILGHTVLIVSKR